MGGFMAPQKNDNPRVRGFDSLIMPRLEISIPMPAGAAVPVRAPQPQPQPMPPAQPSQPAAAQSN
jgi:hypothetical protein